MQTKTITIICAILFCLMPLFSALAFDDRFDGDVSIKGLLSDVDGNEAKFNEYRDITDGVYGRLRLKYDDDRYFISLGAYDMGYDTQRYTLSGGSWGKFRYSLFYQELPHGITFDGRSFFSGVGSDNLTGLPNTDIRTWSGVDYSTERKQYGGGIKLYSIKPFFFDATVYREKRSGIKPISANSGFSMVELPEPIDFTTDTLTVEAGYSKKPFFASLVYFYSIFDNDNEVLSFRDPFSGTPDKITLPPENRTHKISFKSIVRLPLDSSFSLNIGSARKRSRADLLPTALIPTGANFDGTIDTRNYDLVLTSNPVSFIDGKIFYKHYERENKSDEINDGELNKLFGYEKDSFGVEVGLRLPARLRLVSSYRHAETDFNRRFDVESAEDDIYAVEIIWSGIDLATLRVGYDRLQRRTDLKTLTGVDAFVVSYDIAPRNRDAYKVAVDLSPIDNLYIGMGYRYKETDYIDTVLGFREDKRDEFNLDADYAFSKILRIYGYFDYEKVRSLQFQRSFLSVSDPSVQDSANFNWELFQKEETYDYGVSADVYVIPKQFTLRLQHDYIRSNGDGDFTYLFPGALTGGRTNSNIDISNWDDYRKRSYMIKAIIDVAKSLSVSLGYAYEKFTYNDIQLDNYQHTLTDAYLTGAFKDQSYKANIVFLSASYRF